MTSQSRISRKAVAFAAALGLSALALATNGAAAGERIAYPSPVLDGLPYSAAVKAGDTVYVGGVLGTVRGKAELVPGGITPEARQAFAHVKEILELAGSSLQQTVKCVVLLADIDDFKPMNAVYKEYFPKDPPTRSTIVVPAIPLGAAIEVECNALAGD
ncbi:MAG: RidA family protein [Sneathiellaceae bacterium]